MFQINEEDKMKKIKQIIIEFNDNTFKGYSWSAFLKVFLDRK